MSRIFVLILGIFVGYVAYNFGARIRTNREISADSNGDDLEPYPMTLAESIRRKIAEVKASQGNDEPKGE